MSQLPNKVLKGPTESQFERVVKRIWNAGGEFLDRACRPDVIPPEGDAKVEAYTTGCGGQTLAEVPYEATDAGGTVVAGKVVVCVVDDGLHMWPRFQEA